MWKFELIDKEELEIDNTPQKKEVSLSITKLIWTPIH